MRHPNGAVATGWVRSRRPMAPKARPLDYGDGLRIGLITGGMRRLAALRGLREPAPVPG